jgi:nucleoside-diphosphate-sugar epimerase
MIRVAVVGAGGQIGGAVLAGLARSPAFDSLGICRNEFTAGPLRAAGHPVAVGSVAAADFRQQCMADVAVVVNLAAASGLPGASRREDERTIRALAALPRLCRLIHFSSVAVYSRCIDRGRNRFEEPRPDDHYGREKLHLERFARRATDAQGVERITIRLGHVYGAGQWVSRMVIARAAGEAPLPFDGERASNAVHVQNVAAAVRELAAGSVPPGTYDLVDEPQTTWRALFDWHTELLGLPALPAMDDGEALARRARHVQASVSGLTRRLVRETGAWAAGLPASAARDIPTLRVAGSRVLASSRSPAIDQWARRRLDDVRVPPSRRETLTPDAEPFLYSDGAPGPTVGFEPHDRVKAGADLVRWYEGLRSFEALRSWEELWPAPSPGMPVGVAVPAPVSQVGVPRA